MGQRRKFTAEYKREAVAMLDTPGVTVSQIASDLGIGANILGRWQRELRQAPKQAFVGNGRSRDEEVSQLRPRPASLVVVEREGKGTVERLVFSNGLPLGSHGAECLPPKATV